MKKIVYAIHLLILVLAAGCVSFPKQAFDKGANAKVQTIALLVVPPPSDFRVVNIGGTGAAFGLIGAAIESSEEEQKSEEFTSAVAEQQLAFGRSMTEALTRELQSASYRVVLLDQRPVKKSETDQDADYSSIHADADAILDVSFVQAGYYAPQADYLPWLRVSARLIASKTKQRLYAQEFSYGGQVVTVENVEHIPGPEKYAYGNFDALMAKPSEACSGLQAGIEPVARRVADQLR